MVLTDHAQSVVLYPSSCAPPGYHTDELRRIFPYASSVDGMKEGPFVVGVAGRDLDASSKLLNGLLQADAFQSRPPDGRMADFSTNEQYQCLSEQSVVQMYHDKPSNILYLCLSSSCDTAVMNQTLEMASGFENPADLHRWLVDQEDDYCKAFLYLFLISHVVLVTSPVDKFNLHYLKQFRALQSTRVHMSSSLHSYLSVATGLPTLNNPLAPARTVPVLAFVFPRTPELCAKIEQKSSDGKSGSTSKWRKLQQSLETQTRMLLRRFYCPPGGGSPVLFTFDTSRCILFASPSTTTATDYWLDPAELMASAASPPASSSSKPGTGPADKEDSMSSLVRFLEKQRENCRTSRRNPFLPMSSWLLLAAHIRDYICNAKEAGGSDPTYKLHEYLDVTAKFSINQCQHALPVAKQAYLDNLPEHYSLDIHEEHVERAKKVFARLTRGPEVDSFLSKLADKCLHIWEDGRQLCDAQSVTGRPCVYEVHNTPCGGTVGSRQAKATSSNKVLENKPHSSGHVSIHACSCGRSRTERADPFSVASANEFFEMPGCCETLKRTLFTDDMSTPDQGPEAAGWALHVLGTSKSYTHEYGVMQDGFVPRYNFMSKVLLGSASAGAPGNLLGMSFSDYGGGDGLGGPSKLVVYVGVEYECESGHRFFSPSVKPSISEPVETYGTGLPVFTKCHCEGHNDDEMAQLQRIFVVNESASHTVLLSPMVEYGPQDDTASHGKDKKADHADIKPKDGDATAAPIRDSFSPGTYVRIPEDSFCVLRLPYVFYNHEGTVRKTGRVGGAMHNFSLLPQWLQSNLL